MGSRMNFGVGGEYAVPQDKEFQFPGSWIPVTPEKPVPRRSGPGSIPGADWQELGGSGSGGAQSGYFQDLLNWDGNGIASSFYPVGQGLLNGSSYGNSGANVVERSRMINKIAGSYTQALYNASTGWNEAAFAPGTMNAGTSMANSPLSPNLQSQADNGRLYNTGNMVLGNQIHSGNHNWMLPNQAHYTGRDLLGNDDSFHRMPQDGFSLPCTPMHNLNAPPSAEANAVPDLTASFPFIPLTPDLPRNLESNQLSVLPASANESSSPEKKNQEDLITSTENEVATQNCDVVLDNIVDSTSAVIADDRGSDEGIDLNKTPQQKPKRRKYRPKAVVEGKKPKTPKTPNPTNTSAKENVGRKRKYVRKNGLKESTEQEESTKESDPSAASTGKRKYVRKKGVTESENKQDSTKETDLGAGTAAKSCKRALDFDLEKTGNDGEVEVGKHQEPEGCNISNCDTGFQNGIVGGSGTESTVKISKHGPTLDIEQPGTTSLNRSMPANHVMMPENNHTTSLNRSMPANHVMIQEIIRATTALGNPSDMGNLNSRNVNTFIQQNTHMTGISQILSQGRSNCEMIDRAREVASQHTPNPLPSNLFNIDVGQGSKRGYRHATEQQKFSTLGPMASLLYPEVLQMDDCYRNGQILGADYLGAQKRKKMENGSHVNTYSMPSSANLVNSVSEQAQINAYNANAEKILLQRYSGTVGLHLDSEYMAGRKTANQLNGRHAHSSALRQPWLKQHIPSELHSGMNRIAETNRSYQVQNIATSHYQYNHLSPVTPAREPASQCWALVHANHVFNATHGNALQKQTIESTRLSSVRGRPRQQKETAPDYLLSSTKAKGNDPQPSTRAANLINEMIDRIKDLNLNERNNVIGRAQNALVPYKADGSIVPYTDFVQKRKPRPKVDLDPETNRVWKLLMGKEGSEDVGETDKDKQKWWEEERRVFRGRADSFIARMHLIQGDRRFSKWKGSVVDSVIGVYLTQNVSDHLSSSAFMSLVARFPVKSTCVSSSNRDEPKILIEEPEICEPVLDGISTLKWHENLSVRSFNSQISEITNSADFRKDSENSGIERASLTDAHSQNLDEEVLSSQGSKDSSVVQVNGVVRSYSGSNSEAEDSTAGFNQNNSRVSTHHQMGNSSLLEEFYNSIGDAPRHELKHTEDAPLYSRLDQPGQFKNQQIQFPRVPLNPHQPCMTAESEVVDLEDFGFYGERSMSSWASSTSRISKPKHHLQNEGHAMAQQRKHATYHEEISQPSCRTGTSQSCNQGQGMNKQSFQREGAAVCAHLNPNAHGRIQNSTGQYTARVQLTERASNAMHDIAARKEQTETANKLFHSTSEEVTNISKAKRKKTENEEKNAFDWDSLRRQVHANGGRKERTHETMDSLDYEAMRKADVSAISNAIKERGMNNMLAERIKEFLDRLVRDHGSIDLEWLRDVPPDKAKDYLLSIRGLGLKSVECVRLLTLHQVAFPVDTNVGRIAVRLGWVPLQPLPESLQLHLLELYPVLESIQKYLWPRLCMLDQETLYELHYQMITFGKVFCTKSKPNCNACPLRGECRHFASAFASARLSLPGPEEKGITNFSAPIMAERNPPGVFNPLPLTPEENNSLRVRCSNANCAPIVEEPSSPEPLHTEVSQSDIEDSFYEDPDEIPSIRLNVEEFAANLQNYMEENMELQDGDMSKALVALNSAAASLPTPKLKNVSRLRTEHHVYQLPDDHPLLKGMDQRERDDPSPYLLAIWTPGETENSTQPPEQSCGSQETGKLCNESTCFSCNSIREANAQMVRGTILIPCRTAMRGSFPLNGTYFQVNEVFADHESSLNPIDVPREWIWNLPRRIVYFGTSVSSIFKGLTTEGIQYCFWRGFVCVRGFDQKSRAPRPLRARLHFPASKMVKTKTENKDKRP